MSGLLPLSAIEFLGDGTNDGAILGDPNTGAEIAVGVVGGNLVKWASPWQIDVDVPLLGGAEFNSTITNVLQPNAAIKAIAAAYYAALLENPNFIDAITGANTYAALVTTPAAPPTPGFLPASYIEFLGDGYGNILGDPAVPSEIAEGVIGGNLVAFASPYQREVAVPAFGGARFSRSVTNFSNPRAFAKAVASAYVQLLLANGNFVDAITGSNPYLVPPTPIVTRPSTFYPSGGTATLFAIPSLVYPSAGSFTRSPSPTSVYPAGGSATIVTRPSTFFPSGGTYVPWSPANSLALAYATDQYL